jgi:hypothetical protein
VGHLRVYLWKAFIRIRACQCVHTNTAAAWVCWDCAAHGQTPKLKTATGAVVLWCHYMFRNCQTAYEALRISKEPAVNGHSVWAEAGPQPARPLARTPAGQSLGCTFRMMSTHVSTLKLKQQCYLPPCVCFHRTWVTFTCTHAAVRTSKAAGDDDCRHQHNESTIQRVSHFEGACTAHGLCLAMLRMLAWRSRSAGTRALQQGSARGSSTTKLVISSGQACMKRMGWDHCSCQDRVLDLCMHRNKQ